MSKKIISSIMLAVLMVVVSVFATSCEDVTDGTGVSTNVASDNQVSNSEIESTFADVTVAEEVEVVTTAKKDNMTLGQKNALASAKNYLSFTAFSYEGLIEQLEFEDYSHEDAVFAADNCGADWNEQAAKSAKSYLSFSSFSRQSLIDQLEFEGFTHEQAVYGAEANGYSESASGTQSGGMTIGQKNALESAKDYLAFTAFSYEGLIEQLEFEDYSHEDAVFAADNCGADHVSL